MPRHLLIEHGITIDDEVAARVASQDKESKAHREADVKSNNDMLYISDGPVQPK